MNKIKLLAFAAIAAIAIAPGAAKASAQVSVNIGVAPDCPYGYYDYAPYNCVPDGYYGAEWFNSGVFIGVGPWFHGSNDFQGKVDNSFDPQHGYSGPMPKAVSYTHLDVYKRQLPEFVRVRSESLPVPGIIRRRNITISSCLPTSRGPEGELSLIHI